MGVWFVKGGVPISLPLFDIYTLEFSVPPSNEIKICAMGESINPQPQIVDLQNNQSLYTGSNSYTNINGPKMSFCNLFLT